MHEPPIQRSSESLAKQLRDLADRSLDTVQQSAPFLHLAHLDQLQQRQLVDQLIQQAEQFRTPRNVRLTSDQPGADQPDTDDLAGDRWTTEQWMRAIDLLDRMVQSASGTDRVATNATAWAEQPTARLAELRSRLPDAIENRDLLLVILGRSGQQTPLLELVKQLVADPPKSLPWVVRSFAPLWKLSAEGYGVLFPGLLDALAHPQTASIVLDLANYATARGLVSEHPARSRAGQLVQLLDAIANRLEEFEQLAVEQPDATARQTEQALQAIALAISLSFSVSLMRLDAAVGKLYRLLDLRHRRLQVEVAAALARLGDERGIAALEKLSAEPVVRLRVLAYASELGLLDRIPAEYRDPAARAQAELVARLAEPTCYGVPPGRCELIEERRLRWPGGDEPVDVFLFEAEFTLPGRREKNIGIAGPLVHCFATDLTDLPATQQIAAFAGWHAEHPEILEREPDLEDLEQSRHWAQIEQQLEQAGILDIEPALVGDFFGQCFYVARGTRGAQPGTAIVGYDEQRGAPPVLLYWCPQGNVARPIGPEMAYTIFKGERLLETFNPGFGQRIDD